MGRSQLTALFDLALEIAADDDIGHVISYIDLLEPFKLLYRHGLRSEPTV